MVTECQIQRLESVFAESLLKLEESVTMNTEKVLKTLSDVDSRLGEKPPKANDPSSETIHTLENRIRSLKDEKNHLELQIKLEKNGAVLREEQLQKLLSTEKSVLKTTREQLAATIANAREEQENSSKQIKEQHEEIDKLNSTIKELTLMLNNARDEIIQMKMQFSMDMRQVQPAAMADISTHQHPNVLSVLAALAIR